MSYLLQSTNYFGTVKNRLPDFLTGTFWHITEMLLAGNIGRIVDIYIKSISATILAKMPEVMTLRCKTVILKKLVLDINLYNF